MKTRQDYLKGKCTHRQYYAQFVNESTITSVVQHIGSKKIMKWGDFGYKIGVIQLEVWDSVNPTLATTFEPFGDKYTLSSKVCVAKEAARQFYESQTKNN